MVLKATHTEAIDVLFPRAIRSKKCAKLVERETPLEISSHGVRRAKLLGQKGP